MATGYHIRIAGDHLWVELAPGFRAEGPLLIEKWAEIQARCVEHRLRRILVEGVPAERSFGFAHIGSLDEAFQIMHFTGYAIAFVMPGFRRDLLSHCFETAFTRAANQVRYFDQRDAALDWLASLEQAPGPAFSGAVPG